MTTMHLIDHGELTKEQAFEALRDAGFHPRMVLADHGVYKVGVMGSDVVRACAEAVLTAYMDFPVPDVFVPCKDESDL